MKSLIEIFENKPFQDVGTFNSVFKNTPILGYPADAEVEIHELSSEDKRKITVGDNTIYMKIVQPNKKELRKIKAKRQPVLPKVTESRVKLPEIYKILKPIQFMIYMAIQTVGSINGVDELSQQLSVDRRSLSKNIKHLVKLKLIRTEKVSAKGKNVLRISVDLS